MGIFEAILLGAVQGVTEFLPISSSGHLVIFQKYFEVDNSGNAFEILVHLGTLGSIIVVFFDEIKLIIQNVKSQKTQNYILFVIIGTIPAGIFGLGMRDVFESSFRNLKLVGIFLIFTGTVLFFSMSLKKANEQITYTKSILIGFAQALAIFPGISRSGMTICTALFLGIGPKEAARFSFLLAIPAISGAGAITMVDVGTNFQMSIYVAAAAFTSSFFTGLFSLKWLINWLRNGKFHYFGLYCIIIGIITLFM
tara:strand:- start:447 stop:1205 length:759 start_codon:yes stop_codon:yes gene_type:complete